jgi:hypothetical protein
MFASQVSFGKKKWGMVDIDEEERKVEGVVYIRFLCPKLSSMSPQPRPRRTSRGLVKFLEKADDHPYQSSFFYPQGAITFQMPEGTFSKEADLWKGQCTLQTMTAILERQRRHTSAISCAVWYRKDGVVDWE